MNKFKVASILTAFIIISTLGITFSYYQGYNEGHKTGYVGALTDVRNYADIDFEWTDNGDGTYSVNVWSNNKLIGNGNVESHVLIQHYRDGQLLSADHHAGVLTNIGKDWIEDQLGDSPSTDPAKWIAVDDTDASGLSAASTQLTSELAVSGLTRAEGTYASTGVGTWTVTEAFSVTGTVSAQTYSLQWVVTAQSDNNMLCYDTSSLKNCVDGDTLTVTWTNTVT